MNLLLAAALLMQDKSAEETFRRIEEKIEKAKTLSIKVSAALSDTSNSARVFEPRCSCTFWAGGGNMLRIEHADEKTGKHLITVSDGKLVRLVQTLPGQTPTRDAFGTPRSIERCFRIGMLTLCHEEL